MPLNTWVHLAGVYDGAQLRLYRNGTEVATTAAPGALKQCTGNAAALTAIGSHSDGSQMFFGGRIDQVRIYVRGLPAAEVRGVYDEAPVLHLRLDEAYGATQFADESDNGNDGACVSGSGGDTCPVTGEGVHGQLGLAALFDGADDEILAPDAATLRAGEFTVGAWVLPARINPTAPQEIIVRSASEVGGEIGPQPTLHANYRLYLKPNTLIPVAEFDAGCTDTVRRVTSQVSLIKDHWNHVMASFDGSRLVLYVNGAEQARLSGLTGSQACAETGWPFHIGGFSIPAGSTRDWSNPFSGRIDEVTLYNRGLREDEVERLFADQMSWVEERQSNNILVDGDVPECEVASPETYLPAEGMQLLAAARDETSGIDSMEFAFCKSAGACTPGNWAPADACTASNGAILNDGTWCPYFEPAGEGRYIAQGAGDRPGRQPGGVGRDRGLRGQHAAHDHRAGGRDALRCPTGDRPGQRVVRQPVRHGDRPRARGRLTGQRRGHEHGQSDAARRERRRSGPGNPICRRDGQRLVGGLHLHRKRTQRPVHAARRGRRWDRQPVAVGRRTARGPSHDVRGRGADRRHPAWDESRRQSQHAGRTDGRSSAAGGASGISAAADPAGSLMNGSATLSGAVTEHPVDVEVTWTTPDGLGDQVGVTIGCNGMDLLSIAAGQFISATQTLRWQGQVDRGAACQVSITGSAAALVTGEARVCRSSVGSWAAGPGGMSFTADAALCGAQAAVAGVAGAQVGFVATFPGSPFFNETLSGPDRLPAPV